MRVIHAIQEAKAAAPETVEHSSCVSSKIVEKSEAYAKKYYDDLIRRAESSTSVLIFKEETADIWVEKLPQVNVQMLLKRELMKLPDRPWMRRMVY